jgi:hypothetical protein
MTRPTSADEQPKPALPDLPQWGFPDRPSLKLGDEWTTEEMTSHHTYLLIPLKCKVAAREEVGGRMCLRLDVEPTETVPFKLTKTAVADGMQPAPAMLTEFQETIWIGESDGWLVKRTHAIKLEPTEVTSSGPRMHKSSFEDSIQIVDRQALVGKALTERIDQIKKLRYIQAYTHNQHGWRELINVGEACKIADEKIAAFEKEYPKSPYMPAVEVEKRNVEINRRYLATNARWFAKRSDKLGQLAANLTGKTIDGKPFELKDLRGHPALLYFLDYRDLTDRLAPDLDSFARTWSKKGLKTIGIAQRTADSYEKRNKPSFTLFKPGPQGITNWDNNLNHHYTMAVVVILDKEGYIRYYRCGFFPEELSSVLEKML